MFASSTPGQALHVPFGPSCHRSPLRRDPHPGAGERDDGAGDGRCGREGARSGRRLGPGGVRTAPSQGRGPPTGVLRPDRPRGPLPRRSQTLHRGLGSWRRRRGAGRALARARRRRERGGAPRSGARPSASQHRPHRGGGLGRVGHRHQALPGPARTTRARRVVRPPPSPLRGRSRSESPGDRGTPAAGARGRDATGRRTGCRGAGRRRGLFTRPFTLEGVLVTWPRAFARVLGAAGALGPVERRVLAARIARAFPPYAPGGTSHRPTGASPRR